MSFLLKVNELNTNKMDSKLLSTILVIAIMVLAIPSALVVLSNPVTTNISSTASNQTSPTTSNNDNNGIISDVVGQVITKDYSVVGALNPALHLTVLVALKFINTGKMDTYLTDVQTPGSAIYHKYLTKDQFYELFSPSKASYTKLTNYFSNSGLTVSTYADRVSIKLTGTVGQFNNVFHTEIDTVNYNSKIFYAPTKSLSLTTDVSSISAIVGLNNYYKAHLNSPISDAVSLYEKSLTNPDFSNNPSFCNSYLGVADNTQGGTCGNQLLVGSDMQTAYQVNQLLAGNNYPYNKTVATILWNGADPSGNPVAPFYPADLANYFSNVLPAGQPQPQVCGTYNQAVQKAYICGIPVDGAYPQPDITAKNDFSQVNFESTLDLEMIGSIAPGANAIEVYGPDGYPNYFDDAFATILNAPSSSPLYHTVAISNSFGIFDEPGPWGAIADPLWQQYTQEAAALGITVLASSGDNANLPGELPSSPASVAYNNYGVIAVGGTQTYLSGTPSTDGSGTTGIDNQSVWFGTPAPADGSQGGVSVTYPEPVWQQQSFDANNIIKTAEPLISGRGTPDISGIGANMNITISYFVYNGTVAIADRSFRMLPIWGTSVASPLLAGVIADMDQYLGSLEGYFEGLIYQLGQAQFDGYFSTSQPFNDVSNGYNWIYFADAGYDLATGWGSINAYNFVQDQSSIRSIIFSETGLPVGTSWSVTLDNMATLSSSSSTISFLAEQGSHTYQVNSVQGYFSNINQGIATVASLDVNVNVQFSSSTVTGTGTNHVYAENTVSSPMNVNFTIPSVSQQSDLPMSEMFQVPSDRLVNTVSLYLNGTGQVSVSLGTNLWQDDVVTPITIDVNTAVPTWYTVSFPAVKLQEWVYYYYLNVWSANSNYKQIGWGFINNVISHPATSSLNNIGSFNQYYLQLYGYPYNYYNLDQYDPAIYSLGFVSSPPALNGPTTPITRPLNSSVTLSWDIASAGDNFGTQTYELYRNGSVIASGTWTSNHNVTITNQEALPGTFNYKFVAYDSFGGYSSLSVMVTITGSLTYTTIVTSVSTIATSTVTNSYTSTDTSTVTNSTPGFEVLAVLLTLSFAVTYTIRKNKKKQI